MTLAMNFDCSNVVSITPKARMTLRPTSRGKVVGAHPTIRAVLTTIDRVASSSCTVLVYGESGTGKELVVAALHDASPRRDRPMITVNCGAIPVELIEAELFGHARGAFTSAVGARKGLVAAAEGGTLFLDEVGELPMSAQVKLLRLLQQREYTPLGDNHAERANVRIVAATNRDLAAEVAAGRFREDLYYRLNVIPITLPPLRERGEDVVVLAAHFLASFSERCGRRELRGLSESARAAIRAHSWPGNVRALENAIERAVLLAPGPYVEAEDILARSSGASPSGIRPAAPVEEPAPVVDPPVADTQARRSMFPRVLPDEGLDLAGAVESYGNDLIRQALARTGGNKSRAADLLCLNRTTLVEMMRRRGISLKPRI